MISSRPDSYRDNRDSVTTHSVRSDFAGFVIAALIAWKLTVINAIKIADAPDVRNAAHPIFILNAKSCNHL